MSNKQLRNTLRIAHIIEGSLILAYIYSSTLRANDFYTALIQFVIVPAVVISGIALWQQPKLNKLMRRLRSTTS